MIMRIQLLKEFIESYKNETCLWQVKSKYYHNRKVRDASYDKLLNKLQESEPDATKDTILKKISNIRSSYRKEIKKIAKSKKTAKSEKDIYQPRLWYFELLSFIDNQQIPGYKRPDLSDDEYQSSVDDEYENDGDIQISYNVPTVNSQNNELHTTVASSTTSRKRRQIISNNQTLKQEPCVVDDLPTPYENIIKKTCLDDDRFDLFGKSVAMKLRSIPKNQMLLAEKLINDVLFQAEMGALTFSHHLMKNEQSFNSSQFQNQTESSLSSGYVEVL